MKNYLSKNITGSILIAMVVFGGLTSCNKKLPDAQPIVFANQGTQNFLQYLASDPSFSVLYAAILKARPALATTPTLTFILGDSTSTRLMDSNRNLLTFYAPNNAAMATIGFTSTATLAGATAGKLDSLLRYQIIPGEQWMATTVPTAFPNIQLPSLLSLGPIPGTLLNFQLSLYPSRRSAFSYVNNVVLAATDKIMKNGVLHTTSTVILPPSLVLAQMIPADPNLTFFNAMLARGDVGVTDPTKTFSYALSQPFANLTVFAPNNTAVRNFLIATSGGGITATTPDANVIAFITNFLPAASAQGICAYHLLGVKAFSVNFPSTATLVPTFVNLSVPTHPGLSIQGFFTGPFVDSLKILGVAPSNGGIPATSKPAANFDRNAVNGIIHVIDKLLLPQ